MPIYIPGVSFHYFYLHAAFSLPDQSGIYVIQISLTTQVTHVKMVVFLFYLYVSVSLCLVCIIINLLYSHSYWQRISVLLQEYTETTKIYSRYFEKNNNKGRTTKLFITSSAYSAAT